MDRKNRTLTVAREFIGLESPIIGRSGAGGHPCQGIYYQPSELQPKVAVIATHYNIDFSEHYLAEYCAARGLGFLGWNTRFRGAEPYFLLDHAVAEIGVGIRWLREVKKVEKIVLLGNSGGGSLMAAYQSQAVEPNLKPEYGRKNIVESAYNLLPADLYVSLTAHPGRPTVLTNWMDPSILDENDPLSLDVSLDPYSESREIPFTPSFITSYRKGQRARNERISQWCRDEIDRLSGQRAHDRLFTTSRLWADLRMIDGNIDPSERETPSCYLGDPRKANYGVYGVGTVSTCRTWLSMWSLRDSQCSAERHLERIKVPALVIDADRDTGVYPSDTAAIIEDLASEDLTAVTFHTDHYLLDGKKTRDSVADLLTDWIKSRC